MAKIILLNKPFNVLCQFTDKDGRQTLSDSIDSNKFPRFYPAGRLDYDSEGLVILTDNGTLQHRIAHPQNKLTKSYWVQVEGKISESDLIPIKIGMHLKDGPTKPAQAEPVQPPPVWTREPPIRSRKDKPTSWIKLTISEGKNRQVRRMTAAIGFPTLRLIRFQIGPWEIGTLNPGEFREEKIHTPENAKKRSYATKRKAR